MISIERYKELNASYKRELIFHVGATSGFYSELNNMILAVAYCLLARTKFKLYSEDANFRYQKGWTDYFLPFCEEVTGNFHHLYNVRHEDPFFLEKGYLKKLRVLLYRINHRHTWLTSDVFPRFRTTDFERAKLTVPDVGFSGGVRELAREIVGVVYRFNEETTQEMQELILPLKLPEKYVGFHIRGGDKFVEHQLEDTAVYIQKAETLTSLRKAFVSTDDYSIINELNQNFPHWKFYTLTGTTDQGYFHDEFLRMNVEEKRKHQIKLFASMEVLRNSDIFIGTFSSNMGMFLGVCKEHAYGVDFDKWVIW